MTYEVATKPRQAAAVKPRAWSHQNELKNLIGKEVSLISQQGVAFRGELLSADNFTIKIFDEEIQSSVTYFKSALAGFTVKPIIRG